MANGGEDTIRATHNYYKAQSPKRSIPTSCVRYMTTTIEAGSASTHERNCYLNRKVSIPNHDKEVVAGAWKCQPHTPLLHLLLCRRSMYTVLSVSVSRAPPPLTPRTSP